MNQPPLRPTPQGTRRLQAGLSLVEILVGITVGLLTVLAALGTLIVTSESSTTVSESFRLAAAGNTAMRLIATTVRQAGAAELVQANPGEPVSFGDFTQRGAEGGDQLVSGTEGGENAPDTLLVSYEHKSPAVTRDCAGNSPDAPLQRIDNQFSLNGIELQCIGKRADATAIGTGAAQSLVGDNTEPNASIAVEDFQVWYWVIDASGQQKRLTATDVAEPANNWASVDAVEICLQLRGTATNYPSANYTNCREASVGNGGRLHQVFRGIYKLRNRIG